MRYGIPVSGGMLSPHFGHCEHFALIDVDEQTKKILKKEFVPAPEHEPGLLPAWLAEQGVSFVIAGGMGSRAQA
ncbi:NifB/NifX family molybdenum-iron cluster-binding protein, partial [Chloroflexota bacterium]